MSTASPKPILYAISALGGGTGSHLVRLLAAMDREQWRPALVCNGHMESVVPDHVPVHDQTGGGPFHRFPVAQWRQCRGMHRIVREVEPVLLHTYFFWPIIYGRLLKRFGAIEHLVENREDQGFNWSASDYRLLRLTAGIPDRIICVSNAVRDVVIDREGVPVERTTVILNGVQDPPPPAPGDTPDRVRRELGLAPDDLVVGMVANLNRAVKGVRYFVDAIPVILDSVPEARFLVVGEGHEREALTNRARELGVGDRTIFTGYRPDVDRLYAVMDLSTLTSLSEGLSITVLESMSHGLPVVVTRVGGNPELVEEGVTGLMVPPTDVHAFADAVIRMLKSPSLRRSMGEAARAAVRERFSLEIVTAQYEQVYRELLAADAP